MSKALFKFILMPFLVTCSVSLAAKDDALKGRTPKEIACELALAKKKNAPLTRDQLKQTLPSEIYFGALGLFLGGLNGPWLEVRNLILAGLARASSISGRSFQSLGRDADQLAMNTVIFRVMYEELTGNHEKVKEILAAFKDPADQTESIYLFGNQRVHKAEIESIFSLISQSGYDDAKTAISHTGLVAKAIFPPDSSGKENHLYQSAFSPFLIPILFESLWGVGVLHVPNLSARGSTILQNNKSSIIKACATLITRSFNKYPFRAFDLTDEVFLKDFSMSLAVVTTNQTDLDLIAAFFRESGGDPYRETELASLISLVGEAEHSNVGPH